MTEHFETEHFETEHFETEHFETEHFETEHFETQHFEMRDHASTAATGSRLRGEESEGTRIALAAVERQLAEFEAIDALLAEAAARGEAPRRRKGNATSVVFSVRLDRSELEALERRAACSRIRPSVLARNLIRCGLSNRSGAELLDLVDELEVVTGRLRQAVP